MPGLNPFQDDEAPTIADMRDWRDTVLGQFGDLHSDMDANTNLYRQSFPVESPGGRMVVRTGSAPSDADAAVDSLVPDTINVHVKPFKDREVWKKQATKLELWGRGLNYTWRRRHDVVRDIANDMSIRNVGVGRVIWDPSHWRQLPEEYKQEPIRTEDRSAEDWEAELEDFHMRRDLWEVQHRRKFPIILERRSPRHLGFRTHDPDGEVTVLAESYQSSVLEARKNFGRYQIAVAVMANRKPDELVTIDDVWVGHYRAVFIDDQPIFPVHMNNADFRGIVKHVYGEIPYIICPFRELPEEENWARFRGMLSNMEGLYPMESQVLTMHVWMLAWNAWRTWKGHVADGRNLEIVPGKFLEVNPLRGESIEMLQGEPVPPELMKTAAMFDSYIQRNGVASGPRSAEGTRSASMLWAIQSQRQMKIEPARQAMQRLFEQAFKHATMLVESLNQPLSIPVPGKNDDGDEYGEVVLAPNDVRGYYDGFQVTFGKRIDPAVLEQAKALKDLAMANWMPLDESWRLSGLTENPKLWEEAILRQAVGKMPPIILATALQQLANFYEEDPDNGPGVQGGEYEALKQMALQQKSGGQPTGPGTPERGNTSTPAPMRDGQGAQSAGQQLAAATQPRGGRGGGTQHGGARRPPGHAQRPNG